MERLRGDLKAAFARQQTGLGELSGAQDRILQRALSTTTTRSRLFPQLAGGAATLAVGGAVAVVVLLTHGHAGGQQSPQASSFADQMAAGAPASMGSGTRNAYVWFTQPILGATQANGNNVMGTRVDVIDWSGRIRYHFVLPHPNAQVPMGIQAISIDGTRALLDDGTVLDQSGKMIAHIPAVASTMPFGGARWLNDDSGVCVAVSNEPQGPNFVPPHPKGQGPPIVWPTPYHSLAGADHSMTLKVFGLDGSVRTVATVAKGTLPGPSGADGDYISVLSCNRSSDLAVISRIHDADVNDINPQPGQASTSTNMTVSLWAVKLSTGALVGHTLEARSALGIGILFGSENGALALERLWNSKQWGADTETVVRMPSGQVVPVLDAEPIPDTTAISADGTRILRRLVDPSLSKTSLELIDASNGRIIRRITINSLIGATAVPEPNGSGFMVQVDQYVAVVDGNGGGSLIHPNLDLAGPQRQQPGMAMTYSQN